MVLFAFLLACNLGDLTKYGAYGCEDYCVQVLAKTEGCAQEQFDAQGLCADSAASDSGLDCSALSDEQVAEYASQAQSSWAGQSREAMIGSCNEQLEASGKPEAQCMAETGAVNALTCDQILQLLGGLGG
jgi:hypothetical protein